MQIAVGEHNETAVQRTSILARLLFADQGILVLGFGLQYDEWEALSVEQQKVDEALSGFIEIVTKRVEIRRLDGHAWFKTDVGRLVAGGKETPAGCFEQLVDFDTGGGFVHSVVMLHLRNPDGHSRDGD